jgi:hypothetical protein
VPSSSAPPLVAPPPRRRVPRDRFASSLSVGGSAGVGSPLGFLGAFVEYRPWRWISVNAGGGLGGTFGPAVAASLYLDPIGTRGWALGAGVSFSHNFSYVHGTIIEGRPPLPAGTNWVSVELETQFRTSRHWFIRIGVGRAFMLDTQAFNIATAAELETISLPSIPGVSPVDAIRAAANNDNLFGTWFVHIDVAPSWRL